jgi:hypothetical protein
MSIWLKKTWQTRKIMRIKKSLCVSSDIIETANGLWKQITERSASNEVTHLVLAYATFCGTLSREQILELLALTSLKDVDEWCQSMLPITQRQLKNYNFSGDTLLSDIDQLFSMESIQKKQK